MAYDPPNQQPGSMPPDDKPDESSMDNVGNVDQGEDATRMVFPEDKPGESGMDNMSGMGGSADDESNMGDTSGSTRDLGSSGSMGGEDMGGSIGSTPGSTPPPPPPEPMMPPQPEP